MADLTKLRELQKQASPGHMVYWGYAILLQEMWLAGSRFREAKALPSVREGCD